LKIKQVFHNNHPFWPSPPARDIIGVPLHQIYAQEERKMNKLATAIATTIERLGDGVSYVDLSRIEGFAGTTWHGSAEYNQFFWFACSDEAIEALKYLINEEIIAIKPLDPQTSLLVSMAAGTKPQYPMATHKKKYKSPHWVPVVFNKGPKFRRFDPTQ
jgi:hypothetical protein